MKTLYLSLLLALTLLLANFFAAQADIAPPDQPSGANPLPGNEATQVRMLAEEVLIDVLRNVPQSSLGQARVTASFKMQNQGNEAEIMAVRFPLTFFGYQSGDQDPSSEIKEVKVKVNGRQVATRRVAYGWLDDSESPWAEFEVAFPPGEEVPIEVSYLQEGVGEYPFISLDYTLETGAEWNGTIGTADLILRLPYEANPQNVIFDEQISWSQTTPGGIFDGREVRWHYENLEPGWEHNLQVSLAMPRVWQGVLNEQERIERNPADGEAWGRLGKLYKELSRLRRGYRSDSGGQELYRLSVAAYEKTLELLPNDAAWHAGFADLLWWHFYYDQSFRDQPNYREMLRALRELDQALEINPRQEKALEVLLDISYALPEAVSRQDERFDLLWLTATPNQQPNATQMVVILSPLPPSLTLTSSLPTSQIKSSPVSPTETQPKGAAIAAMQSPVAPTPIFPQPSSTGRTGGLCGGAVMVPLALVFWLGWQKSRPDQ